MSNTLIVAERRGRIAKGDATRLLTEFLKQLPALRPVWPDLLPRAHSIAESTVASVYDSLYLALVVRQVKKIDKLESRQNFSQTPAGSSGR